MTSLISSLSPLFPASPHFEPHITITSNLSINSQTDVTTVLKGCVAALKEFEIDVYLDSVVINDKNSFFKKLFIGCKKTKNLVSFSEIIREMFVELPRVKDEEMAIDKAHDWSINEFDPHISLIYTDLTHFDNALIRTISTRISDYLNCDSYDLEELRLGWNGGILKIVRCEGLVEDWQVLGSVDIH